MFDQKCPWCKECQKEMLKYMRRSTTERRVILTKVLTWLHSK